MVSKLQCATYPPLGDTWWKQAKIGFGALIGAPTANAQTVVFNYTALPGGGTGRYPGTGNVTLTLYTPGHPTRASQVDFAYEAASFVPRNTIAPYNATFTDNATASVLVYSSGTF